ncbi:MAG: tripartite tricarboxylate transporter substrate binding protein [Lachnospiraceae bacterium]|nr:tripartite tricarboxylate transporter substrate binding protein [Lachnospiraceae bacterium]
MKKLMAMLLAVVMVLSLTACGGSNSTTEAQTTQAQTQGQTEAQTTEAAGWVPTKDIEFVIPFGAGGGNDLMVRKMVEIIEKYKLCPVNVVPVNKKGGSGVVGYTYLKDYKAGYEYALASTSASFFTQPITGNSPFNPDTSDFSFVAHIVKDPCVICATPKLGFTNLDDVVKYAKANPGGLKWGGVGNASDDAIIMYMLNTLAGVEITYVPYDDQGLLTAAVLGGHIDMCATSLAESIEHMQNKTMTAIAAVADNRLPDLPDVPTVLEEGYDIAHQQNRGIVMNPGVADEVLAYYSGLFEKVCNTDDWKEFVKTNAMADAFMGYKEWTEYALEVKEDYTTYLAMVPQD